MSEKLSFEEIGARIGQALENLDDHRAAVTEAEGEVTKAQEAVTATEKLYAEQLEAVRAEGYVSDNLLAEYGHATTKGRGRPKKSSGASAAAPAATK